jgi:hypothetical protein
MGITAPADLYHGDAVDFWNEKILLSGRVLVYSDPIRCQKRAPVAPATVMNIPLPIMSVC